ncbi:hypothetical protein LU631_09105 [Erwinia tracheiphila]|uniref:Uncharacterized protein n=1 Tax=Erwinia tracheiphila TaxID=65700 RepID=A0A0M2KAL5_9GAMM|nr:hypothetical protein [Erwinia tracheiphila]AXF75059.1 hypothetical protein AV903_01360 [Erwinia tracheiphila]EOS92870.1 hypothetical protein ETR_22199 [Erwinia tracheiphila PSU-1]KKF34317.1 hypothetical protein SY86_25505 [Erwinia tracheiphila]UIA82397.1 hypothetical protein LU604_17830 [Erwinia tracheiphila]UIA89352.1 hypothetical protein LU631_09105 [Erwinia tracheiphila]
MAITEEKLLASGFTPADVQKLKNNIDNYGGSFDQAVHDLSNRFRSVQWISIVAFVILLLVSVFSSKNNALSLLFALITGLPFIWYLAPAKLAYKSWKLKKRRPKTSNVRY